MAAIQRILCPTDLSEASSQVFRTACIWARQFGAELHLLHVVEGLTTPYPYHGLPVNEATAFETMLRQRANAALNACQVPGECDSVKFIRQLRSGSPATEIVNYADEAGIDLIVMGTHGRGAISHAFLGSVAEKVVRRAHCSVLTVRPSATPSELPVGITHR